MPPRRGDQNGGAGKQMPKPLYGGKKGRNKRGGGGPLLAGDETSSGEWITLSPNALMSEDMRFDETLAAFAQEVGALDAERFDAPSGTREMVASSFLEAATSRPELDCEAAWIELLQEVVEEQACIPLGCNDDEASADGAKRVIAALMRRRVLCDRPPLPPPLAPGDDVLAVLSEDGEWHQAEILPPDSGICPAGGSGDKPVRGTGVLVRFLEWGKVQRTAARDVIRLASAVDDDGDDAAGSAGRERHGECQLCARSTRLTFHHLVPKETHHRYVGKGLPEGLPDAVPGAEPTRQFLHSHGVEFCRPCHSAVHRFAPNGVLAQRFHTLDRLIAQEALQKWAKYAAKSLKH
jgi:hypothetical protein